MALIDFTLSSARRFYSSMENPLGVKGLNRWMNGLRYVATDYNEDEARRCDFLHSGVKVTSAKWSDRQRKIHRLPAPNDNPDVAVQFYPFILCSRLVYGNKII